MSYSVKRYAKLISDEKGNATKLGFLDGGTTAKKRAAPTTGGTPAGKKAKKEATAERNDAIGDEKDSESGSQDEDTEVKTDEDEE
jgi:hypothetical protein